MNPNVKTAIIVLIVIAADRMLGLTQKIQPATKAVGAY